MGSTYLRPWRVASYAPNDPQLFASYFHEEEAQEACGRLNAEEQEIIVARLVAAVPDLLAIGRKIAIAAIRSSAGKRIDVIALREELLAVVEQAI